MRPVRAAWAWLDTRAALRMVQLLVLVTIVTSGLLMWRQSDLVACNTEYNRATADYDTRRADLSARDRQALDSLIREIREGQSARAAIDHYLATRAETDRLRAESPPVRPPADLCG